MALRFARLRLSGFKSFVDPTTVEILPGLTGIVGPNGCGKSNIVEAVRWAMGETSAKAMRGGEMDDVIFAGTATRPGRNLAEVTLNLEEAEGLAPPPNHDQPELEIVQLPGKPAGFLGDICQERVIFAGELGECNEILSRCFQRLPCFNTVLELAKAPHNPLSPSHVLPKPRLTALPLKFFYFAEIACEVKNAPSPDLPASLINSQLHHHK